MTETLPTHATCPKCGHETKLHIWVYAHWNEDLIATCEKCGLQQGLRRGVTYGLPRKRKKPVSRKADGSRKS